MQSSTLELRIRTENGVRISTCRELLSLFVEGSISISHYDHCINTHGIQTELKWLTPFNLEGIETAFDVFKHLFKFAPSEISEWLK